MTHYDEASFTAWDPISPAAPLALIGQVMTASGAVVTSTYTGVNDIRTPAASSLVGGFVIVDTAGVGSAYTLQVQSGTKVLSSVALVNTAGNSVAIPADAASTIVAAAGAYNISIVGTGTASATQNSPALRVSLNVKYQFV